MAKLMVTRVRDKIYSKIEDYIVLGKNPFKKYSHDIDFFKNNILDSAEFKPVFFLSTGRTGTKLFTEIMQRGGKSLVLHSPRPELIKEGKQVYETLKNSSANEETVRELIFAIFLTAREQLLYKAYIKNRIYIETNNRITFFAPIIKEFIPNAKFVYLYRHPGEFVRSGIRRKWYSGTHAHDVGRIVALDSEMMYWNELNPIEKISWLWSETNGFIESFLKDVDANDFLKINFNEINEDQVNDILDFVGLKKMKKKQLEKMLGVKVNKQSSGKFDVYEDWDESQKDQLRKYCLELASSYGYHL